MKLSRFDIVGAIAAALSAIHVYFKRDGIDQNAMILLGVAALSYLIPSFTVLLSKVKKLKWGEFEAEFEEEIRKFEEKVVVAENQAPSKKPNVRSFRAAPLHSSYVEEYKRIIASPSSGREKVILGAVLAERMIQETVRELELDKSGRLPARSGMQLLLKEGLVSPVEVEALDEYWKIRNSVVHGSSEQLTNQQVVRLLELLWRLVSVFG